MGDRGVQSDSGIRFEWGPSGAGRLAGEAACLIVVDISDLHTQGAEPLSAEAAAAKVAYEDTADLTRAVSAGVSGRELAARGFVQDVAIATEGDVCAVVPVRDLDGAFAPG